MTIPGDRQYVEYVKLKTIKQLRFMSLKQKIRVLTDEYHIVKDEPLRHKWHYLWNRFGWGEFDPWISSCSCCCVRCEGDDIL